jgi:hypothetical protein
MTMTKPTGEAVLRRRYRSMPERKVAFVDVERGIFLHERGDKMEFDESFTLVDVIDLALDPGWESERPEVVYLIGCWNAASTPRTEWFEAPKKYERVSYHRNPLIASYALWKDAGIDKGRKVAVYGTAQWFGECDDIDLVRRAYARLKALLRGNFGMETNLMATPARTGLDLLERSLPVDKEKKPYEWPVLDKSVREMIEHNIGQGRMEMLRQSERTPQTDKLYILDAIWMYSSCCRRLPSGPVEHDTVSEFAGYQVAYYRVEFQVPAGWSHIGLLPTWNPKERRTIWPSRPSKFWYTAYVCSEELRLALDNNWSVQIKERWLFSEGDGQAQDPLRNWISSLRELREGCTDERESADLGRLLRGAIRAICIKAIGSLHRKGRYLIIETPIARIADVPADAEVVWRTDSHIRWRRPIPLDANMAHFAHPEWSAYIWGRARAKLAKKALELPREAIIALRSDALALTFDPDWRGTKPGEFRLKKVIDLAGRSLPATTREYLDLLHEELEEE